MRSLSKHRIKLNRYRLSGATHRSGIGATFCVRWLVVASSSVEAHAANPIHRSMVGMLGGFATSAASSDSAASFGRGIDSSRLRQPAYAHTSAKTPNAADQM